MNTRRFRALRDAGATYTEIAAEVGCDWRTVKKYLAPTRKVSRRGPHRERAASQLHIDPLVGVEESDAVFDALGEPWHPASRVAI